MIFFFFFSIFSPVPDKIVSSVQFLISSHLYFSLSIFDSFPNFFPFCLFIILSFYFLLLLLLLLLLLFQGTRSLHFGPSSAGIITQSATLPPTPSVAPISNISLPIVSFEPSNAKIIKLNATATLNSTSTDSYSTAPDFPKTHTSLDSATKPILQKTLPSSLSTTATTSTTSSVSSTPTLTHTSSAPDVHLVPNTTQSVAVWGAKRSFLDVRIFLYI